MERLTTKREWKEAKEDLANEYGYSHIWNRLREIEDILGDDYDLDRLREQVEKVWRGEWVDLREAYNDVPKCQCSRCGKVIIGLNEPFCKSCGAAMTDKAVDMVMERLEALYGE